MPWRAHGTEKDKPRAVYSGPKARVAIADFEVKAAKATGEVGLGVREMLVTAFLDSNRFSVMERHASAAPADLVIAGSVSEFEPHASGGRSGLGGGGGSGSGILGGLLGSSINKAHIALDVRIVDTLTSEVLAATRIQGQASDVSLNIKGGFFGGGLGAGLSAYSKTPMEKAIRICISEAVRYMSQNIPAAYYKY